MQRRRSSSGFNWKPQRSWQCWSGYAISVGTFSVVRLLPPGHLFVHRSAFDYKSCLCCLEYATHDLITWISSGASGEVLKAAATLRSRLAVSAKEERAITLPRECGAEVDGDHYLAVDWC